MRLEVAAVFVGLVLLVLTALLLLFRDGTHSHETDNGIPDGRVPNPVPEVLPGVASSDLEREPAPPAPSTSSVESTGTEFLAVDQATQNPVAQVGIYLSVEQDQKLLGFTDGEGKMSALLPETGEYIIRASAEGRRPWSRSLQADPPAQILIELSSGHSLSGTVLTQDGKPAGAGVQVVAWAMDEYVTLEAVQQWFDDGSASFPTTETDGNGKFTFHELRSNVLYEFLAGGDGMLAPSVRANAGGDDITLALSSIYGLIASIRYQEGRVPEMLVPFPGLTLGYPHDMFEDVYPTVMPHLLVAGIDVREYVQRPGYDQAYFFLKKSNEKNLGPITYGFAFPGYERDVAEMFASRVAEGLNSYLLELRPLSDTKGAIVFTFDGAGRSFKNPAGLYSPIASLYLTDSFGFVHEYPVDQFDSPLRLEEIPHDHYSYRLILMSRLVDERTWEGAIDHTSATTTIGIPVDRFGAISISLSDPAGEKWHSKVTIELVSQETGSDSQFTFQFPPYRMEGIPAGNYSLRIVSPKVRSGEVVEVPLITVPAGGVIEQSLTLTD